MPPPLELLELLLLILLMDDGMPLGVVVPELERLRGSLGLIGRPLMEGLIEAALSLARSRLRNSSPVLRTWEKSYFYFILKVSVLLIL